MNHRGNRPNPSFDTSDGSSPSYSSGNGDTPVGFDTSDSFSDNEEIKRIEAELDRVLGNEASRILCTGQSQQSPTVGKYIVKQVLGQHGQAFVLEAFDPDLKRTVVIKVYRDDLPAGERERLIQEGRALSRVDCPHVVNCLAMDEIEGLPALVLEHLPGKTLAQLAAGSGLGLSTIVDYSKQLLLGVGSLHKAGLLHGDIKPSNVVVSPEGKLTLIDLGLSQPISDTRPFETSGTPGYLSPERARNESHQIDQRSDLFGVGAILYFMIFGKPPFDGDSRQQVLENTKLGAIDFDAPNSSLSQPLICVCQKATAAIPADRFHNTEEFANALASIDLKPTPFTGNSGVQKMVFIVGMLVAIFGCYVLVANWPKNDVPGTVSEAETKDQLELAMRQVRIDSQIKFVCSVLTVENGKFIAAGENSKGDLKLELDVPAYIFISPAEPCYLVVASVEYEEGMFRIDPVYPYAEDSGKMLPFSGDVNSLDPNLLLDGDGFSKVSNLIEIMPNSVPGRTEYLYVILSSRELPSPSQYKTWLTKNRSDLASWENVDELMRGIERRTKSRFSNSVIPYRVFRVGAAQ